jgi:flagellar hook-length control protein FliK
MRTEFAEFPLPAPPPRNNAGGAGATRRDEGLQTRERFALPPEARGQEARGQEARGQETRGQEARSGAEAGGRGARSGNDDAARRQVSEQQVAGKKASQKEGQARSDAATDRQAEPAQHSGRDRAMGAVSLIALMRTGSADAKGEAMEADLQVPILPEGEDELLAEGELSTEDALLIEDEPIVDPVIDSEAEGEADAQSPSQSSSQSLLENPSENLLAQDEEVGTPPVDDEEQIAEPVVPLHGNDEGADEADEADAITAEQSEQQPTASAQNASARNADPARGELPAQASDAARAALARAPGLAGRTAGAEGAAVAAGDQAADAQPGEDADGEGASTALKTGAGEGRGGTERLTGVDQEAARRGAAEAGGNPSAPPRQAGSADEAMKAFEAFKPGANAAAGETAGQQQAQPALDATKAAAGAQPSQTNGAVLVNTPLSAVPLALGMKAMAGASRFEIRLDPAELGRIDVRLDIDKEGNVKARLTVDRVETLHLLQRDARTLERAFEQAGLKPSEEGIDLSLRDDRGEESRREARDGDEQTGTQSRAAGTEETGRSEAELRALARETLLVRQAMRRALGGVDLNI